MKKRTPPQASKQKQLRRQFGGAFGKAPVNLQHFLATDLPIEGRAKTAQRVTAISQEATEELERLFTQGGEQHATQRQTEASPVGDVDHDRSRHAQ